MIINENHKVIIDEMSDSNDYYYNLIKTCEELTELQEVLIKKILKKGSAKEPSNQSIIDEIGDVYIRIQVLANLFGKENIKTRVFYKLEKFKQYLKDPNYKGKV